MPGGNSSGFVPGDEVVCIDGTPAKRTYFGETLPQTGKHYTVREVLYWHHETLLLNEIVNEPREYDEGFHEGSFNSARFRPVKRESIEAFKRMAQSTKPTVDVDA